MKALYKYGLVLPVVLAWGCAMVPTAKHVVAAGDPVLISFSCRTAGGDLVVTTDKAIADDAGIRKSALYFPFKEYAPLSLKAGVPPEGVPVSWGFMDELHACLAKAAPGMVLGESSEVACRPELVAGRVGEERFLKMSKVRSRKKELRIPRKEYDARIDREPVKGAPFTLDPEFPGILAEVNDKEVVVAFHMPDSGEARTPFGIGKVRDAGDTFEIELPVKQGDPVRTGALAGRVSEVSDKSFTIDYGYSFAGEQLNCRVTAMPGEEKK